MTYEVKYLHDTGDGYIVVTLDDGTTFGQNVRDVRVQSVEELDEYVSHFVGAVLSREAAAAVKVPQEIVASARGVRPIPLPASFRNDEDLHRSLNLEG